MTTNRLEVYECEFCGNIVELIHGGGAELVCCGQRMTLLPGKNEDQGKEKHVPVVQDTDTGLKVTVGSVAHPMEAEHYIEMIELVTDTGTHKAFLKPGQAPEALFCNCTAEKVFLVREYCTVHGLWSAKL